LKAVLLGVYDFCSFIYNIHTTHKKDTIQITTYDDFYFRLKSQFIYLFGGVLTFNIVKNRKGATLFKII